jgi:hypothetical protein
MNRGGCGSSLKLRAAVFFVMNEFFAKMNYEYLLEQISEIGSNSRVGNGLSGTHKKEKRHPFLGEIV